MVSATDINKISTMKRFLFSLLSDFNEIPSKIRDELLKAQLFRFFEKKEKEILIEESLMPA